MKTTLILIAAVIAGYAGGLVSKTDSPVAARGRQTKPQSPRATKLIKTERIELVDPSGRAMAMLRVVGGEPLLSMYDKNRNRRLSIGVSNNEPGFALLHTNGKPALAIDLYPREYGTKPEPAVVMYSSSGLVRSEMMLTPIEENPEFNIYDAMERKRGALRIRNDEPGFAMYDTAHRLRGYFYSSEGNTGIDLIDDDEKVVWSVP
ncbi:MAG: hypothetical protein ABFD54_04320 [Armatimonadota bacterium]